MKKKEEIPCIFYFYLHYKLKEKYKDIVVSTKDAMSFLFEWRLPKEIRPIILRELEILDLVEKIGKKQIRLKNSCFKPEDIREYCQAVGVY